MLYLSIFDDCESPLSKFPVCKQIINEAWVFSNCSFIFCTFLYLPMGVLIRGGRGVLIKGTNGLVMNPEQDKTFLSVWLLYWRQQFLVIRERKCERDRRMDNGYHSHWWNLVGSDAVFSTIKHLFVKTRNNTYFQEYSRTMGEKSLMWCSRISKKRVKKWSNSSKQ